MDPGVPPLDRLYFLAIVSSNLDEFFRVRVASLRGLAELKKKRRRRLGVRRPRRLIREIRRVVTGQQEAFGRTLRGFVLPALAEHGIELRSGEDWTGEEAAWIRSYFREALAPLLEPLRLDPARPPFLADGGLYLVAEAGEAPALVRIPSHLHPRFVVLPGPGHQVAFLDDLVRAGMPDLFPDLRIGPAFSVKLSRDADLLVEDEFEGDLVEKVRAALESRDKGTPSRFLYDPGIPAAVLDILREALELEEDDLIEGGRYHNLKDFFSFPAPADPLTGPDPTREATPLRREALPPLPHPDLPPGRSVFDAMRERDILLHFPYQAFDPVVRFFREAAADPEVVRVGVTLYRVAEDSEVVRALIEAARAGKETFAFVEVKARFDEARNLHWAEEMEAAGVRVVYSMPGLKVHAKVAVAVRREKAGVRNYAYLATGNFNESTARLYADHGLFTADPRLADEAAAVLEAVGSTGGRAGAQGDPVAVVEALGSRDWEHLLVAPTHMREAYVELLAREAEAARRGEPAGATLKMNSLEDTEMIDALYAASGDGVPIRMVVRGIFRLRAGVAALSESIRAVSILDRFLEHARIYRFRSQGEDRTYLSSADWMKRNLSRRVEVAFPIYDPRLKRELGEILEIQLNDRRKARILDPGLRNEYLGGPDFDHPGSQLQLYRMLEETQPTGST